MSLVGEGRARGATLIYNSRNYMSLVGLLTLFSRFSAIYNSRNYMSLVGLDGLEEETQNLQ